MEYFKLLKRKTIAILWLSQLLSAIGDQIYLVSACWLAAQISPRALACVAASEYVSAFLFSFVAGVLTDRFNKKKLMIYADLGRAIAVFTLPIASLYGHISTMHLVLVGIVLGSLGVLFDPCLVATIPVLTDERSLLQATNGLIDFTKRLARALGPAIAGLLASFVAIHFLFSLNAISFLISTAGILYVSSQVDIEDINKRASDERGLFWGELLGALRLIKTHAILAWEFGSFFFANIAYALIYTTGLPLLAKERFGNNIAAYGLLISIYGVVSIIANLIEGNRKIRKPALTVFRAYALWGLGFSILALAPNIVLAGFGLAVAAISAPAVFITIVTMVQRDIPETDTGKVYSFRTAIMYSGLGLGLLLSSYLYGKFTTIMVMPCAAAAFLVIGISGILRFYKKEKV